MEMKEKKKHLIFFPLNITQWTSTPVSPPCSLHFSEDAQNDRQYAQVNKVAVEKVSELIRFVLYPSGSFPILQ